MEDKIYIINSYPLEIVTILDASVSRKLDKKLMAITSICFSYNGDLLCVGHAGRLICFDITFINDKDVFKKWDLPFRAGNDIYHIYFSDDDKWICAVSKFCVLCVYVCLCVFCSFLKVNSKKKNNNDL